MPTNLLNDDDKEDCESSLNSNSNLNLTFLPHYYFFISEFIRGKYSFGIKASKKGGQKKFKIQTPSETQVKCGFGLEDKAEMGQNTRWNWMSK